VRGLLHGPEKLPCLLICAGDNCDVGDGAESGAEDGVGVGISIALLQERRREEGSDAMMLCSLGKRSTCRLFTSRRDDQRLECSDAHVRSTHKKPKNAGVDGANSARKVVREVYLYGG
jgi:hypothetical protein